MNMRNTTSAVALAAGLFVAGFVNLAAQAPVAVHASAGARHAPPAMTQPAAAAAAMTIVGCLKEEKDVAGLKPNVAERVGVTEDYILTSVKAAPGQFGVGSCRSARCTRSKALMDPS